MKKMIYVLCALILLCATFLLVSCNDDTSSTPSTPTHVCSGEWSTFEATCTIVGSRSRICTSCGKYEQEITPTSDHAYTEDNFCEKCHVMKEGTYTEGLEYSFSVGSSTCTVTDVGNAKNETKIIIPAYYNGRKVTSIRAGAFLGCSSLKSIDIPRTVDKIGEGAFSGCSALETMRIPTIGGDESLLPFWGQAGYYFGKDSYPGSQLIYQHSQYKDQYDYKRYVYDAYVPLSLKTIILTGSTEGDTLGGSLCPWATGTSYDGAFSGFPIETLIVESSVTQLEVGFDECTTLKNVIFEEGCVMERLGRYHAIAEGGGLFEGCTALETIVIPNSVKTLGASCFRKCTNLKNITLPESLTTIGDQAFYGCSNLKNITLPESLTTIGDHAFYECSNLKTVYNNSRIPLEKGSESYGYVAYYAETIINK